MAKILKYGLEIKVPKSDKQLIDVLENMSLGSSDRADIQLEAEGVAPLHLKFKLEDEVLSITNLGGAGKTKVGRHELGQGKTYIVDKGDKISIGKVVIVVKTEKIEENEFEQLKGGPNSIEDEEEVEVPVQEVEALEEESGPSEEEELEIAGKTSEEDTDTEQEEDEVREDAPEKTSTLVRIRRIIDNKRKAGGGPVSAGKAKKAKVNYPPIPGFFIRSLSIIINLVIIFGLYFYVLPDLKLEEHINPYIDMIIGKKDFLLGHIPSPYREKIPAVVISSLFSKSVLLVIILYLAFDLISHLLFGTSFALFLAGVTDHSNIIFSRIKAIFRFVLGLITMPFLIFDLPLIARKRSFKEVLTFTHLKYRNGWMKVMAVLIIYPLLVILVFGYPLLPEIESLAVVRQASEQPLHKTAVADPEGEHVRTIISKSLSFKAVMELKPHFIFIPTIEKSKPKMMIYDKESKSLLEFAYQSSVDFNEEIKKLPKDDFYFAKSSPRLNTFLGSQKAEDGFEAEIESILKDSMILSAPNLHKFVLSHGPFFGPYLPIRSKILESLGGASNFLYFTRARQSVIRSDLSSGQLVQYVYMPMTGLINDTYTLSYNTKAKELGEWFVSIYEHSSPVRPSMVNNFTEVEEWNGFIILDLLSTLLNKEQPLYPKISQQTYNYFFKMIKSLDDVEDKFLERKIAGKFKDIDLAIKEAIKLRPADEKLLTDFNYSMNRLQKAFEEKDENFFKMNAP